MFAVDNTFHKQRDTHTLCLLVLNARIYDCLHCTAKHYCRITLSFVIHHKMYLSHAAEIIATVE